MGFVLNKEIIKNIKPYPEVSRKLKTAEDKGWTKVGKTEIRKGLDIIPQVGMQENVVGCEANLIFSFGAASMGKGMVLNELVLTPNGWIKNGDLKVGSIITDSYGKPQKVTAIYDRGVMDMYEIETHDGGKMSLSLDHLCIVNERKPHYKSVTKILEFKDIKKSLDGENNLSYSIPVMYAPVEYEPLKEELPIDPYILGNLLGNGCLTDKKQISLSTSDLCIAEYISKHYKTLIYKQKSNCYVFVIKGIESALIKLNLLGLYSYSKFIPKQYLHASIEERRELLKGLMDSDGSIDNLGGLEYSTSSKQLALDFQELVRSLGGMCSIKERIPIYTYKGEKLYGRLNYRCYPTSQYDWDMFKTHRKAERANEKRRRLNKNSYNRRIIGYKYLGKQECRCIKVSNPDHLYITRDFILTHNTYSGYIKSLRGLGREGYSANMISFRLQDSKKGSSILRDAISVYSNYAGCTASFSEYPTFSWDRWNSYIRLIHSNFNISNPKEFEEFKDYAKKTQASYMYIDEVTEMKDIRMLFYWFSRNRDSSGMKPCIYCTFNSEHEHWTTQMMVDAGYVGDDWYIKPEMIGVIRYFYVDGNGETPSDIVWGISKEDVLSRVNITLSKKELEYGLKPEDMVKSFTVQTGEAADNLELVEATGGQSIANLHVGGKNRAILKEGYLGVIENEELNVTRQMINNLPTNPKSLDETMYGTLDVSGGGLESDGCPFIVWKGDDVIAIEMIQANPKELIDKINAILYKYKISINNFAYDAGGLGYYLTAYTNGMGLRGQARTITEIDEFGNTVNVGAYFNQRSQLMDKTKVMLEKGEISFSIPLDMMMEYGKKVKLKDGSISVGKRPLRQILYDEINVFIVDKKNNKIYYRSKDEYKAKFKSSPDIMDAIILKAAFNLDARPKKQAPNEYSEEDYDIYDDDDEIGIELYEEETIEEM